MVLTGKHIIVTGGTSGIGLATARAALCAGAEVTIVGRTPDKLQRAALALEHAGRVRAIRADITVEDDIERLFGAVGRFYALVNTAADVANTYRPITECDLRVARKVIDSKLIGAFLLAKHGGPLIDPSGAMIFTSGIAAARPAPNGTLVAAVNGALEALARALALELAPVRVNVVSPGWVDTPIWEDVAGSAKDATLERMARRLPSGAIGQPEDVAQAIILILQNRHITGTTLHVDGGQRLI